MRTLEQTAVISDEDRESLSALKEVIQESLPTATVLLYGSVARGAQDPESDYDILVLTDEPLSAAKQRAIRGEVFDFELPRGIVFSIIFCEKGEWDAPLLCGSPFRYNVERDAIVL